MTSCHNLLFFALFVLGCGRPDQPIQKPCATDAECSPGTACRIARCRKICSTTLWVGQTVQVRGLQGPRTDTISDCEPAPAPAASSSSTAAASTPTPGPRKLWVRYDSGLEEQVELKRVVLDGSPASRPDGR